MLGRIQEQKDRADRDDDQEEDPNLPDEKVVQLKALQDAKKASFSDTNMCKIILATLSKPYSFDGKAENFKVWKDKVISAMQRINLDESLVIGNACQWIPQMWHIQVYGYLLNCLSDDLQTQLVDKTIRKEQDASLIWKKLINIYQRKTILNQKNVYDEFTKASMKDSETIQQFTNRLRKLADAYEEIGGETIKENQLLLKLIEGVLPKYHATIRTLNKTHKDAKFDDIVLELQDEEELMNKQSHSELFAENGDDQQTFNYFRGNKNRNNFKRNTHGNPGQNRQTHFNNNNNRGNNAGNNNYFRNKNNSGNGNQNRPQQNSNNGNTQTYMKFQAKSNGNGNTNNNSNGACYVCKKLGHWKRDCYFNPESANYKGKPWLENKNRNQNNTKIMYTNQQDEAKYAEEDSFIYCNMSNGQTKVSVEKELNSDLFCSLSVNDAVNKLENVIQQYTENELKSQSVNKNNNENDAKHTQWIADTGASAHATNDNSILSFSVKSENGTATTASKDEPPLKISETGCIRMQCENTNQNIILKNVKYSKSFAENLLSIPALEKQGAVAFAKDGNLWVIKNNTVIIKAERKDKLYYAKMKILAFNSKPNIQYDNKNQVVFTFKEEMQEKLAEKKKHFDIADLYHRRLVHLSPHGIKNLIENNSLTGIDEGTSKILSNLNNYRSSTDDHDFNELCNACELGKHHRNTFKDYSHHQAATQVLERIYADVAGPFNIGNENQQDSMLIAKGNKNLTHWKMLGEYKYYSLIVDEYSRRASVKMLKQKSETSGHLIPFILHAENVTGNHIKYLRSDNGKEYVNKVIQDFCSNRGIGIERTCVNTPQHNAIAERMNRSIMNSARTILFQANLSSAFFGQAVTYAVQILNYRISKSDPEKKKSAEELFTSKKPNIKYLRIFGCDVYVHAHDAKKLDERSTKCIFIGIDNVHHQGYRCYDPISQKIIVSRDVTFNEFSFTVGRDPKTITGVSQRNQPQIIGNEINEQKNDILEDNIDFDFDDQENKQNAEVQPQGVLNQEINGEIQQEQQLVENNNELKENPVINNNNGNPERKEEQIINNNQNPLVPEIRRSHRVRFNIDKYIAEQNVKPRVPVNQRVQRVPVDPSNQRIPPHSLMNSGKIDISNVINSNGRSMRNNLSTRSIQNQQQQLHLVNDSQNGEIKNNKEKHSEPLTFAEAMNTGAKDKWKIATDDEIKSMQENNVWDYVYLPVGANVVKCKWIFKLKYNKNGEVERYKARLCAKGFSQIEGIDYNETFAPVMKYKSLRIILALATEFDYEIKQMDVKTAFLNAKLDELVYMEQPEGYQVNQVTVPINKQKEQLNGELTNKIVCKLNKSLYGLKQAPYMWNEKLNDHLVNELDFTRCTSDTCVYVRKTSTNNVIIMCVFVDDIIIIYHKKDEPDWLNTKEKFIQKFKTNDMGDAEWILGMELKRNRNNQQITITQQQYIHDILEYYNLTECKTAATPEQNGIKLTKNDCPELNDAQTINQMKKIPYRAAVGALLYASLGTRPDISHSVNEVSRYLENPGEIHWNAVKRIIRYLAETKILCLNYKSNNQQLNGKLIANIRITAYSDSDWAGDLDDRKSTSGYVIKLNGNTVIWNSKKQKTPALSSAEAEYMAMVEVGKELKWMRQLISELLFMPFNPKLDIYDDKIEITSEIESSNLFTDNQAAQLMTKHDMSHNRTKHIDLRYHWIRNYVSTGEINVQWIPTDQQLADILTKGSITTQQFKNLRKDIMN